MRRYSVAKKESGFTLLEISIVLIVMGLLVIPLLQLYNVNVEQQKIQVTQDHIKEASNQLVNFRVYQPVPRFACPSDRGLAPEDPKYGLEFNNGDCSLTALKNLPPPKGPLNYQGSATCTGDGGFCIIPGARHTAFNTANSYPDPVLVGGIPIRSLTKDAPKQVTNDIIYDGYGNQLTYAVTQSMADSTLTVSNTAYGVIGAIDENDKPSAGVNDNANYAVISHGANANGAFSRQGVRVSTCGALNAAKDNQNCSTVVARFRQALGSYRNAAGGNYYDDFVFFEQTGGEDLWKTFPSPNSASVYNTNLGNIGIKTSSPSTKVEVAGTVRGDTNILATQVCEKANPTKCFNIDKITGATGSNCAAGTVAVGISGGSVHCVAPTYPQNLTVDCGTKWFGGVLANGTPVCF